MEVRTGLRRVAGAPISWGVCEVPGWGAMLPPDRVFAEMSALGIGATELGPLDDWLPLDAGAIRAALEPHGLALVGGFVPLVLHEHDAEPALARARHVATKMAAAGADTFVLAIVGADDWSLPEQPLDAAGWKRLGSHVDAVAELTQSLGLTTVVHPHVGTLVERAEEVERLLETTAAGWCLDPGHLLIGGYDPIDFARRHGDRVAHVHLKDVDLAVAARLNAGELTLMEAVQADLFRPLGEGDAQIAALVRQLAAHGYDGWTVLEQDTAITGAPPAPGEGPARDVAASLAFLAETAAALPGAAR
ncbi:sugar phosphate isomerase/epimerase [Conexibacter stalactiti]|uniref:Sugar phosphate isomerase/epimerase n=1 Tax=Conexibacter stalactiti TaxID=1940611 RepID=A0ABU4HPX7_9ACTN|nr:sugar phosphate isomerase/epimerase [Conexibacter stalactiti]MDW5595363.1 sugar phosphate isomerase/epimerase [Conexibacter stalactiti]MEC5036005.1 sugar phosphate isomerase/epimerase [Conexibacter stalactiti]